MIEKERPAEITKRLAGLSPEKRKLLERRFRQERSGLTAPEPVAVVGMACRLPGDADNPEALWKLLLEGRDAISEIPADRWDASRFNPEFSEESERSAIRWGGFLNRVGEFDPVFFNISPREAEQMDPQQRLLLMVAWEALESGGLTAERLAGSSSGVFVGVHSQSSDYYWRQIADPSGIGTYTGTGGAHSIVANRLSYFLDLRGPSMVVDTACSSSLVAIHLACRSLRDRECDLALAGGVNLILSPETSYAFSKLKFLSRDGHCRTFDANADGFVRGEGCAVIVLRRLSEALRDGDPVLSVVCGSAVNQDGATNGLTAPNGHAQSAVVRQALANAGVHPSAVGLIETHGTGTVLGDPIEVEALKSVFGLKRSDGYPCYLGAVKSNIGHLEAAAGIAGVVKTILCLKYKTIPSNANFIRINPYISLEGGPFEIPREKIYWDSKGRIRHAGVSSFGFGGTNVHVVLREAPELPPINAQEKLDVDRQVSPMLLPLSAHTADALDTLRDKWLAFLGERGATETPVRDICYTAGCRRTHREHRMAIVGKSHVQFQERLKNAALSGRRWDLNHGSQSTEKANGLVFVFSGQGPQWYAMGRELLSAEPVFRDMVVRCDQAFSKVASWSLMNALTADQADSRMDQTEVAQPSLFALQMGLAALWNAWGIMPDQIVGHSVGEVAAACCGGVLSLEDAACVVYHRGRLLQKATGQGRMAAVEISPEAAAAIVVKYPGRLSIAAFNSPNSVTLSGEVDALEEVLESLKNRNYLCRMLSVKYAFHSHRVEIYREEMAQAVEGIGTRLAKVPILSTVTGRPASAGDFGAAYWAENIRRPVQFAAAIDTLIQKGCQTFIELSPHPVLGEAISQCVASRGLECTPLYSLRRNHGEIETMLEALGALYVQGRCIDWEKLYPNKRRCIDLPGCCWQNKRYWIGKSRSLPETEQPQIRDRGFEGHFLTGRRVLSPALKDHVFEFVLNIDSIQFLNDHRVYGEVILPAPVLMEISLSAARASFGEECSVLKDFRTHRALVFEADEKKTLQVILIPEAGTGGATFEIMNLRVESGSHSYSWEILATGRIQTQKPGRMLQLSSATAPHFRERQERCRENISVAEFYRGFVEKGVNFGPLFQVMQSISRSEGEAFAIMRLPEPLELEARHYQIHPVLVDACIQLLTATWNGADNTTTDKGLYFFFGLEKFQLNAHAKPSACCYAAVQSRSRPEREMHLGDAWLFNEEGACIAEAKGIFLKRAGRETLIPVRSSNIDASLFKVLWRQGDQFYRMNERLAPNYFPSTKHIVEQLQQSDNAVQSNGERHLPESLLPQLDQLCTAGILRAFHRLGWEMRVGDLVDFENMAHRLGTADRHRRLLMRMFEMLQDDGILKRRGALWEVVLLPELGDPGKILLRMRGHYLEYDCELTILERCLENLPRVLLGEVDPVNLLFPDGSVSTAEKLYQDAPLSRRINAHVRKAISFVGAHVPEGRLLRILEIGGGTGGTTAHVLPGLPPDRAEYLFTDISNFFLDKAIRKFGEYPFMSYRILDIEKNPEKQGISPHQFDLVIASNVMHATADLRQTLQHVSQCLAPDGLLLIVEGVRPTRWIDMTFGLTLGWWRFVDNDLRPSHPLITRSKWVGVLSDLHFRDATVFPPGDDASGEIFDQAVIIAQGPVLAESETLRDYKISLQEGVLNKNREERGTWLIFADQSGVGARLAEILQSLGVFCILVYPGKAYEIQSDARRMINPSQAENYYLLAQDVLGPEKLLCRTVIFLWGLDAELSAVTSEGLERAASGAYASLCSLINGFLAAGKAPLPRIWIVTRGAQSLSRKETPQLGQAPLWGIGRVIAVEHPDLWGGLIDLDPNGTVNEAARNLSDHVCCCDGENQLLLRATSTYFPCLVPWEKLSEKPLRWVPEGYYLITGGLGDLGLQTARWMVEQGVRRLILLSRTPLPERTDWNRLGPESPHFSRISSIQRLEASGADVRTGAVDVADEAQLRSFLEQLRSDGWSPIRGVIHTAGVAKDALISQADVAGFHEVWRSKAGGAWLLHQLLEDEPLDFFILFSSLGSLLGQTGQGSYAAANAFLDALANLRSAHGQPVLSVNWGSWIGSGLAITPGGKRTIQNLSLRGIEGILPQKATEAMGVLMQEEASQVAVTGVNWERFRRAHPSDIGYLTLSQWTRYWIRTAPDSVLRRDGKKENLIREQLVLAKQGPQRRSILEGFLSETLAGVLRMDISAINPEKPFGEMGLDSLMALEMKNCCEKSLGLKLSASMTWNHPTIHILAGYLSDKLGIPLDEPDPYDDGRPNIEGLTSDESGETSSAGVLGSVSKMTDEEALQALLGKAGS